MGQRSEVVANFGEDLARSHSAEDLPFWRDVYQKAFPAMVAMVNHRQDGDHQRAGIDRSIVLANSKQVLVDEKVRFRNRKTGKVYADIALEYLSDAKRGVPGWVCKPLLADYIAYAIAPLGKCYMLPVVQLQQAWQTSKTLWQQKHPRPLVAENEYRGRSWETHSTPVSVADLFGAIGQCLRLEFTPVHDDGPPEGQQPLPF